MAHAGSQLHLLESVATFVRGILIPMEKPSAIQRPLPTLDDFEMYFKTDIRPQVKRILSQRLTAWERTDKAFLSFVILVLGVVWWFAFSTFDVLVAAGMVSIPFILSFVLIVAAIATGVLVRPAEADVKAALAVASRSHNFFGWTKPAAGTRQRIVSHAKYTGLFPARAVNTTWSAERSIGTEHIWLGDAKIRGKDSNTFVGFLMATPITITPNLKMIARSHSEGAQELSRGLMRFGLWLSDGGLQEARTGNSDFDNRFIVHTNNADLTNGLLSFLFLQEIMDNEDALRRMFEVNDIELSFAISRSMLLITVNGGRQLIPAEFDYTQTERAIAMIYESFAAVDHLVENLVGPLQEEAAKLGSV